MKKIIIATRGSKLALWQSEYIKKELLKIDSNLDIHLKIVKTTGDKILDKPLSDIGGKGLFIKEVEEAILNGEAQIAVHSLKDFPVEYDKEHFTLAAIPKRASREDVFLSETYKKLSDLPECAVIGTSSIRRAMQLKAYREDLIIKDLRGNIDTRINKLKDGEYDAIILAYAGIKRLELLDEVKYIEKLDTNIMVPAMGQGALAVETNKDEEIINLVSKLDDKITRIETTIERDFVRTLNLGCHAPVGIKARFRNDGILVRGVLLKDNKIIKKEEIFDFDSYEDAGKEFAKLF